MPTRSVLDRTRAAELAVEGQVVLDDIGRLEARRRAHMNAADRLGREIEARRNYARDTLRELAGLIDGRR